VHENWCWDLNGKSDFVDIIDENCKI